MGETVSPTRLIFQHKKALSKCDGIKAFIALNMICIYHIFDNYRKEELYSGSDIHDLYCYLYTIGAPYTLNYSSHNLHCFGPNINKDTGYLHSVITALRGIKRILFSVVDFQEKILNIASSEIQISYL